MATAQQTATHRLFWRASLSDKEKERRQLIVQRAERRAGATHRTPEAPKSRISLDFALKLPIDAG